MEQIYTIPVNEAFEASAADKSCGCPFCTLYRKLENDELELILGASMMDPDIRIKTNKTGFCSKHYGDMLKKGNRLSLALMLESHLDELKKEIKDSGFGGGMGNKPIKRIGELEESCYVCDRITFNFEHMVETAVLLWNTDEAFPAKMKAQPYFCLPHYKMFLQYAQAKLPKKRMQEFCKDVEPIVDNYIEELKEDVSWFCKKFDYRYDEEPWYNSKDAVERAMKFLRSDLHRDEKRK